MGTSRMVWLRDVMRVLKLRDELDDLPFEGDVRLRHAADVACVLLGAQVGVIVNGRDFRPGPSSKPHYVGGVEGGWMGDAERAVFYRYLQGDHAADPCVRPLGAVRPRLFTRYREQLVSDRDWYGSDHVNGDRKGAGVDAVIYSGFRTDGVGSVRLFGLHRPWGERRPFTERDRTLLHLLHHAVAGKLVAPPLVTPTTPALPPRLGQTLRLLLQGLPEKQVALRLGVTRHTAHGYVKELYHRLGVESRAELMARWVQ